jgi:polysaccharide chain length determinant protein (PEP-CTERM system associated)
LKKHEKSNTLPTAKSSELAQLNSLDQNPVYQRMKINLKEAEVAVAEARSKLAEASTEVLKLRRMVNTIPEVEAQLAALNRDYDTVKAQHQALLAKLESARLSENVEQSRDDVRFRIIEPPVAPLKPVSPNRPIFMVIVLVGAIGAGLGLAFLLHQMNRVFVTRNALREATGLPVLGSVSLAMSTDMRVSERRSNLRLAMAAGLLVVVFGAALAGAQLATTTLHGLLKG